MWLRSDQPARFMGQVEFHRHIGEENLRPTFVSALERARVLLAGLRTRPPPVQLAEQS
jgi:hypothetical protein